MIDTEFSLSRELIGFAEATVKSLIQPTRSNKSPPYGIINILRNYCAGRVKESDVVCEIKETFDDHVDYVFRKRMQNARHTHTLMRKNCPRL